MAKIGPTIGWFIYDGIQLAYRHDIYGGTATRGIGVATLAVIDVSVHLRMNDRLLGFAGVGPGFSYNGETAGVGGKGRLGLDVLIGRSGLFRPAACFTATSNPLLDLRGTPSSHNWNFGLELEYAALF